MNACSSLDLGCSNLFIDGPAGVEMAHRLSTVMRADTIVVLQQGNIKEIGTHSELVAQQGLYPALWKEQSGG